MYYVAIDLEKVNFSIENHCFLIEIFFDETIWVKNYFKFILFYLIHTSDKKNLTSLYFNKIESFSLAYENRDHE